MGTEPFTWAEGSQLVNQFGSERHLAERLQVERKRRGWSQAELARQLEAIGYPLHQSVISKIEPPDPDQRSGRRRGPDATARRKVTIGEAIAFSRVLDIPLGELLLPPEAVLDAAVWRDFIEAAELRNTLRNAQNAYDHKVAGLRAGAKANSAFADRLRNYRTEVMDDLERSLRELLDEENETRQVRGEKKRRWNRAELEANRPPVVVAIDDVLKEVDE
jgi:hypothetical protein